MSKREASAFDLEPRFAGGSALFEAFPKIARWNREVILTEKLDGSNASIWIDDSGNIRAAKRHGFISPDKDNFGFAAWVEKNRSELSRLGPGRHFGEWWGVGIQRTYGLSERRFSLFNTSKWLDDSVRPSCCHVVPVLYQGPMAPWTVKQTVERLRRLGSYAEQGYMRPEGIVVFHTASNHMYKITLEKDEKPKGAPESV